MVKKIVDIGATYREIRDTGATLPPIDPAQIAAALGAEPMAPLAGAGSPLGLHAVRAQMSERLRSSGGSAPHTGTDHSAKIPLSDQQWEQLETIAAAVAASGCAPSAGQVASVLLNLALQSVLADIGSEQRTTDRITKEQLKRQLVNSDAQT